MAQRTTSIGSTTCAAAVRMCWDDFGARSTLNGYRYAERMLLYALYAERPQKIGDLQQYVSRRRRTSRSAL